MKGPKHISEVFIEMAASNSDPLGRLLRKLPFIQAELLKRKIISLNDWKSPVCVTPEAQVPLTLESKFRMTPIKS